MVVEALGRASTVEACRTWYYTVCSMVLATRHVQQRPVHDGAFSVEPASCCVAGRLCPGEPCCQHLAAQPTHSVMPMPEGASLSGSTKEYRSYTSSNMTAKRIELRMASHLHAQCRLA